MCRMGDLSLSASEVLDVTCNFHRDGLWCRGTGRGVSSGMKFWR